MAASKITTPPSLTHSSTVSAVNHGAPPHARREVCDSPAVPHFKDPCAELEDRSLLRSLSPASNHTYNAASPAPRHNLDPNPAPPTRQSPSRISRRTKAHLKVATLNMNGRGSLQPGHPTNKWNAMHALMRDKKIGILALQETHLTPEFATQISRMYGRRLVVVEPSNQAPSNARGVTFILNRELTNVRDFSCEELIPDCAALLTTTWHDGQTIRILNVYAPNSAGENGAFWSLLHEKVRLLAHRPTVLLGDFNLVLDASDRMPPRVAPTAATTALQGLIDYLDLRDGWRESEPSKLDFTFPQNGSRINASRLDRIYTTEDLAKHSLSWDIEVTAVPTDHKLVSVNLSTGNMPYIGRGRWQLNASLLSKKAVLADLRVKVTKLEQDVERAQANRTDSHNPQLVYAAFKNDLCQILRKHSKMKTTQAERKLGELNTLHSLLTQAPDFHSSEDKRLEAALLQEQIHKLEIERHAKQRLSTAANVALTAETNSKYWTQLHKERKPRDILYALKKPHPTPDEDPLETRSDRMAEIARTYHENLQHPTPVDPDVRRRATRTAGDNVDRVLSLRQRQLMDNIITEADVRTALHSSALGKASGLDGLTYELWKVLDNKFCATRSNCTSNSTKPGNILASMAIVFTDIQTHGLIEHSTFTEGWMCPIYKQKGDRKDIASYRPITLLNSDYKLMTKVVALRLASVAPTLIHTDQAGFIPGRKITDQTLLCQHMIDFAEADENDGLIVALDQEKAYDKISHDYLWKILKRFGFSPAFISTIQALYSRADTRVVINGELSTPYRVTRGVRQGDPMSCILFNLAIEPLACMLRNSDLAGYDIPGCQDRLVTKLFADDTTVYLSCDDSMDDLLCILDTWCLAADAKFNISKTKIIPIGSQTFRDTVITTRKYNPCLPPIPCGPTSPEIVPDGKPTRILGAFLGNKINSLGIWEPIIEKIRGRLEVWSRSHPSMKGKALIVQMVVGGMTQFLTAAQGMPGPVEDALTRTVRDFLWDNRQSKIKLDYLREPPERGGLNLLDIKRRNEAIALVWLKTYLNTGPTRPTWAFVADLLLERAASATARHRSAAGLGWVNPFLQTWMVPRVGKNKPKPMLAKMLETARRYNVSARCVKPHKMMKRAMPAWLHIGMKGVNKFIQSKPTSKCLRATHRVNTVDDLRRIAARNARPLKHPAHFNHRHCTCTSCVHDRDRGCPNPDGCASTAQAILQDLHQRWDPNDPGNIDGLTLTKRRLAATRLRLHDGCEEPTLFNPSITTQGEPADAIRIFTGKTHHRALPIRRRAYAIPDGDLRVALALERPAKQDRWNIGLHVASHPPIRLAWTAPGHESKVSVELKTIAHALTILPPDTPLVLTTAAKTIPHMIIARAPIWEDHAWLGATYADELRAILALLRARSAPSYLQIGDPRHDVTREAQLNLNQCPSGNPLPPLPSYPTRFLKDGMKLSELTQARAYKAILKTLEPAPRPATIAPLDMARLSWATDSQPHAGQVWKSIRDPAFPPYIQTFLWRNLHNSFGCGKYWANIPGRQTLELCPTCGVTESMEHILLDCSASPPGVLWRMARSALANTGLDLPRLTLGHILGIGLTIARDERNHPRPGATRLLKIVVSETAYLIWKLRCERRIEFDDNEDKYHTTGHISSRWLATMNKRMRLDAAAARSGLACRKPSIQLVLATWSSVLENEHSMDDDWTSLSSRVLVGMEPRRRQLRPLRISAADSPGTCSSPTRSA